MFILKGKDFEKEIDKLNVLYWIVTDEETEGELVYDSLSTEEFCFRLYEDGEVEGLKIVSKEIEAYDNSLFDIEKEYMLNDELVLELSCDLKKEEYFHEWELEEKAKQGDNKKFTSNKQDNKKRKNIKWNENKEDNYRGNFSKKSFKFNNSDKTFCLDTIVSYKSLKQYLREIAELAGANEITILNEVPEDSISINFHYDNNGKLILKFKREIDVEEGCKREFGYYDKSVLFNRQK